MAVDGMIFVWGNVVGRMLWDEEIFWEGVAKMDGLLLTAFIVIGLGFNSQKGNLPSHRFLV